MKILLVNDIGSRAGGAETMMLLLKERLTSQGHTVKILAGTEDFEHERFDDYTYKTFSDSSPLRFIYYAYNPFAALAVHKALKKFKPDIVHLHNVKKASASILFCLKKYPTIMTVHDITAVDQTAFEKIKVLQPYKTSMSDYFIYSKTVGYWVQKYRFKFLRYGQKNIDLVIAPSKAMKTVLVQGGMSATVKVIYNGIPRPMLQPTKTNTVNHPATLLFVGRIFENKGIFLLIEAFAAALKSMPLRLVIVGSGPALNKAKAFACTLKVQYAIQFTGYVKNHEIGQYYAQSDVVVIPSIGFDNLPTVAIEAMNLGKPLLVSNSGGLPELVDDNVTGIIIPNLDVHSLSQSMLHIFSNRQRLQKMSQKSLRKSVDFSAKNYIKQTLRAYNEVIESQSSYNIKG